MSIGLADIFASVRLNLETGKFEADATRSAEKVGGTMGERIKRALTAANIGTAVGASLGAAMGAGIRMGEGVDKALDSIRVGTGATGDALKGLEDDFKSVASRVPNNVEEVGQAIADLNTRTGQTGEGLQDLAKTILDFSRITKSDVATNVRTATRVFGDWSIATEDQAATLDKVFRAAQNTGIGVSVLMDKVVEFGSPLRLLGFQFEESIALLAKWEKEGVNTETALAGLKYSVKTLAREGVPAAQMAETLQKKIAAIQASADPVGESIKLFGLRAGPDLAAAIKEGRFATEDLLDAIKNGDDTIAKATEATDGFGEMWKRVANTIQVQFGGIFTAFAGMGNLVYLLPAIGGALGRGLGKMWTAVGNSGVVSKAIAWAGGKAATVYLAALIAGDKIGIALKGLWTSVASSGPVLAAAGLAGGKVGAIFGGAVATAGALVLPGLFLAALAAGPMILFNVIPRIIGSKPGDESAFMKGALGASEGARSPITSYLERQQGAMLAGAANAGKVGGQAFVDGYTSVLRQGAPQTAAAVEEGVGDGIEQATPEVQSKAWAMLRKVLDPASVIQQGKELGHQAMLGVASGILAARQAPLDAFDTLKQMLKDAMSPTKERARLLGELTSKAMAKGLKSHDPAVRAQAEATKQIIIDRLVELKTGSKKLTEEQARLVRKGIKSQDPEIRAAAKAIRNYVRDPLVQLKNESGGIGSGIASNFADGLDSLIARQRVKTTASGLATLVRKYLKTGSPSELGPFSEGGGPEGWGRRWMDLYQTGMRAAVPQLHATMTVAAAPVAAMPVSSGGASLTINVSTPVLTPGGAEALARHIAPSITRWQQQRGI